jgi:proline iminopeptidase
MHSESATVRRRGPGRRATGRAWAGAIDAPGARIWCRSIGRGPALLLLHGGPGADHTDFVPWLLPLARRHRLIFVDQRGSGRSERLADPRGYTVDAMIGDLEAVRKAFGLRRLDVLGHSFGGILAQAYAIRRPQSVRRLILAGTAASARTINADFRRMRAAETPTVRARLAAYETRGIFRQDGSYVPGYAALCARVYAPYMYRRGVHPARPEDYVSGWHVLREMWVRRSDFKVEGNLRDFDFTRQLRRLAIPALVVIGDHDMVSARSARELAAALPDSELHVLPRAGHMMYVDDPETFNELVARFLEARRAGTSNGRG